MPAGLKAIHLENSRGSELDPAAVLQVRATIPVGGQVDLVFLLGQAHDLRSVREIVRKFRVPAAVETGLRQVRNWWDKTLGTLQVQTPDLSVNFLLNRWLTWRDRDTPFWTAFARFNAQKAVTIALNLACYAGLIRLGMNYLAANVLLTTAAMSAS
jgi:cyclic beta-1,2-glucan synthetase